MFAGPLALGDYDRPIRGLANRSASEVGSIVAGGGHEWLRAGRIDLAQSFSRLVDTLFRSSDPVDEREVVSDPAGGIIKMTPHMLQSYICLAQPLPCSRPSEAEQHRHASPDRFRITSGCPADCTKLRRFGFGQSFRPPVLDQSQGGTGFGETFLCRLDLGDEAHLILAAVAIVSPLPTTQLSPRQPDALAGPHSCAVVHHNLLIHDGANRS